MLEHIGRHRHVIRGAQLIESYCRELFQIWPGRGVLYSVACVERVHGDPLVTMSSNSTWESGVQMPGCPASQSKLRNDPHFHQAHTVMRMDSSLAQRFINTLRAANRASGTIDQRIGDLRRFESTTGVCPERATAEDLLNYLAGGINTGWKPEYAKRIRSSMRVFYEWLNAEGIRGDNPALRLPAVRVPRAVPVLPIPTETAIHHAYDTAETVTTRLILALAAVLGLRRTEIATLRLRDRYAETLKITGKGAVSRRLKVDRSTLELLEMREAEVRFGEFYFPSRFSGHVHPCTIYRWIRHTGHHPHALRRRAGTNAHAKTHDLPAVQAFLGHASLDTTQHYVRSEPTGLERIADVNALDHETTFQDEAGDLLTELQQLNQRFERLGWRLRLESN